MDSMKQLPFKFENLQLSPSKIAVSPITPWVNWRCIAHPKLFTHKFQLSIQQMDLPSIIDYFDKYTGKHNQWNLQHGRFGDICIIQFNCIEDAENVLKKHYHRIQNNILSVDQYDVSMIDNQNAAGKPFSPLNPKMWQKILNHLDVIDLCATANTCTQFQKLGEQVFSSKFDKITWHAGNQNADDIFSTFGHLISSLDVDIVEPYDLHFNHIAGKCTTNLRNLGIWMNGEYNAPMHSNTLLGLKVLFSQLQQLEINCRQFFDYNTAMQLLTCCSMLESLSINCLSSSDLVWNNISINFPQLKQLKFQLNATINDIGLEVLLTCNPGIKKLYIDECPNLTANAIEIIARCVPWLEDLTLGPLQNYCPTLLHSFSMLYYLKSLQILLDPALPLMSVIYNAGIQIEHLELWYVSINGALIEQLTCMKSIKELTIFSYSVTDHHLEMIAEQLPFLGELRLAHSEHVTIDGLTNMVCSAQNLTVLHLSNMKNINESNEQHLQTIVKETNPSIHLNYF